MRRPRNSTDKSDQAHYYCQNNESLFKSKGEDLFPLMYLHPPLRHVTCRSPHRGKLAPRCACCRNCTAHEQIADRW